MAQHRHNNVPTSAGQTERGVGGIKSDEKKRKKSGNVNYHKVLSPREHGRRSLTFRVLGGLARTREAKTKS